MEPGVEQVAQLEELQCKHMAVKGPHGHSNRAAIGQPKGDLRVLC